MCFCHFPQTEITLPDKYLLRLLRQIRSDPVLFHSDCLPYFASHWNLHIIRFWQIIESESGKMLLENVLD